MITGSQASGPYSGAEAARSVRNRLGPGSKLSNIAPNGRAKQMGSTPTGKAKSWTLKAVCLSNKDARRVPCGGAEREALVQAGLGERKIYVGNIDCSSDEFRFP